jgi:hypothetical protein
MQSLSYIPEDLRQIELKIAAIRAQLETAEIRPEEIASSMSALRRIADHYAPELPTIGVDRGILRINEESILITPMEEAVLGALIAAQGKSVSRERLLSAIPGTIMTGDTRSINVVLSMIRSKVRRQLGIVNLISYYDGEGWSIGLPKFDPRSHWAGPADADEPTKLRQIIAKVGSFHARELQRLNREVDQLLSPDVEVRRRTQEGWIDMKAEALKLARQKRAKLIRLSDIIRLAALDHASGEERDTLQDYGVLPERGQRQGRSKLAGKPPVRKHTRHYI